jgi:hypothetical protein
MHGFPYDPRCYNEVVPRLFAAGYRAIVPYLRGYCATRFLAAGCQASDASGSDDRTIRLRDVNAGAEVACLETDCTDNSPHTGGASCGR